LAGAPPTLTVTGAERGEVTLIDNEAVGVDADGVIQDDGRLTRVGTHVVKVGRVTRRVEIVDAALPALSVDNGDERTGPSRSTALPVGAWTVLGATAGDIAHATSNRWAHGTVVVSSFDPVWALSFGGGKGATVMALTQSPGNPVGVSRRSSRDSLQRASTWANAVHSAQIRRPSFLSPDGKIDPALHAEWLAYVRTARAIKRALKSHR
jgi:hypothetical protein